MWSCTNWYWPCIAALPPACQSRKNGKLSSTCNKWYRFISDEQKRATLLPGEGARWPTPTPTPTRPVGRLLLATAAGPGRPAGVTGAGGRVAGVATAARGSGIEAAQRCDAMRLIEANAMMRREWQVHSDLSSVTVVTFAFWRDGDGEKACVLHCMPACWADRDAACSYLIVDHLQFLFMHGHISCMGWVRWGLTAAGLRLPYYLRTGCFSWAIVSSRWIDSDRVTPRENI